MRHFELPGAATRRRIPTLRQADSPGESEIGVMNLGNDVVGIVRTATGLAKTAPTAAPQRHATALATTRTNAADLMLFRRADATAAPTNRRADATVAQASRCANATTDLANRRADATAAQASRHAKNATTALASRRANATTAPTNRRANATIAPTPTGLPKEVVGKMSAAKRR
eukprot:g15772.t1